MKSVPSASHAVPSVRADVRSAAWTALAAIALTACGGGSGSSTGSSISTPLTPATPVTPANLTVSGTVSTGTSNIASAAVDSKCATGTGSTTVTASTGGYGITIAGGKLPCMLRATLADGTSLHTYATTGTDAATANLTPLTELVVAQVTGSTPVAA